MARASRRSFIGEVSKGHSRILGKIGAGSNLDFIVDMLANSFGPSMAVGAFEPETVGFVEI